MTRSTRWPVGALWATCLAVGWLWPQGPAPTQLTILSVGQGDCAVFQHGGTTVMVDVGPATANFDGGERIVVPDLHKLGVTTVDLILLSHPDLDHVGGLGAVLDHFRVGRIAIPAHFRNRADLTSVLERRGFEESAIMWTSGETFAAVGEFTLRIDTPDWHDGEADNDGSMFVRIAGEGASCVFSGDASSLAETAMLERTTEWSAQVLKAGHHGSAHSSGIDWIRTVRPRYAVLSVGRNNRYGHPAPSVMRRFEAEGVRTLRTDRQGDIVFRVGRTGFEWAP